MENQNVPPPPPPLEPLQQQKKGNIFLKIIVIIVVLLLVGSLISTTVEFFNKPKQNQNPSAATAQETYTNSMLGFQFNYPDKSYILDNTVGKTYTKDSFSQLSNPSHLVLQVQPYSDFGNVSWIFSLYQKGYCAGMISQLYSGDNSSNVTIDGVSGAEITGIAHGANEVVCVENGNYDYEIDLVGSDVPSFENMLSTFKFLQ